MRKLSWDEITERANKVHKNLYAYFPQDYKNTKSIISIMCYKHGIFKQEITSHLQGHGCPYCYDDERSKKQIFTKEEFVKRATSIHGNKYDYGFFEYKGSNIKGKIICPEHGEFWQTPSKHINLRQGCPLCNCTIQTTETFIKKAKQIHGDKYDYSKVDYKNAYTDIEIICSKHGLFKQTPHNHLHGEGCPLCKESKLEKQINDVLKENSINFIKNANKSALPWLERQHLDFYLPGYNIAIECQGKQHYIETMFFEPLKFIKKRDNIKKEKCATNGVDLIYFSNKKYDKDVFINTEDLINYVKNKK